MAHNKNLLIDLPLELVDQIAHYPSKADLLTLRRVNRDVAARCDRAVLQHVPNELEIMSCSRRSLETAHLISTNPTWKKMIQSVSICQDQLSGKALADWNEYGIHRAADSPCPPTAIRAIRRRREKACEDLLADQNEMVRTGADLRVMLRIYPVSRTTTVVLSWMW